MNPRWDEVQRIFDAVADLDDPDRAAALEAACGGDAPLRAEVESLLRHDAVSGPLDAPVRQTLDEWAGGTAPWESGRRIGPYRVISLAGIGGMGDVYRAVRDDGEYGKQVALKLVRRGLETSGSIARFRRERQILALLEHPNIARLLDGGVSANGAPWFAMEFVEGVPITEHCQRAGLPIRGRVTLLLPVCDAVSHAHRRLVIHRDIKPGNVLVTASGEVKLLDFGIATLLDEPASGTTRIMTPEYASPEQLRGQPVTTATDVFLLGRLLRDMLAGAGRIPADLEAAIAKATRDEPDLRYQGPSELAADLERWLTGAAVLAHRGSLVYGARKYVHRHWAAMSIAALLVAGSGATAWQAWKAERRFQDIRRLANTVLFDLHDRIRFLPGSIDARRILVNTSIEYLDRLSRDGGGSGLRAELAQAWMRVGDLQGRPGYPNTGDAPGALVSYGKALALSPPGEAAAAVEARRASVLLELGRVDEAERAAATAERSAATLAVSDTLALARMVRGFVLTRRARLPEAVEKYRSALAAVQDPFLAAGLHWQLGDALAGLRRRDEALIENQTAVDAFTDLWRREPDNTLARGRTALAISSRTLILAALGRHAGAEQSARRALSHFEAIAAHDPADKMAASYLASGWLRLGLALEGRKLWAESRAARERAAEGWERLLASSPEHLEWRSNSSLAREHSARMSAKLGETARAISGMTAAVEARREVLALAGDEQSAMRYATALLHLEEIERASGTAQPAGKHAREAARVLEGAYAKNPAPAVASLLAIAWERASAGDSAAICAGSRRVVELLGGLSGPDAGKTDRARLDRARRALTGKCE